MFVLRSHSVCQLTIERTLNKNKILTEGTSKHGESCLKIFLCLNKAYFNKRSLLYHGWQAHSEEFKIWL